MPNPFLFALVLSYVVFLSGLSVEGRSPIEMLQFWNDGFWSLLRFGMQMVLILATGYVLAYHPSVQRAIRWVAHLPSTGRQAIVLVGLLSMVIAWVHWGLGLVVGAVLAREMGRQANERGLAVHYPLLCVAGYMGIGLTWHWGLSGSAQLIMNTPHNIFIGLGVVPGTVSPSQTIFHPYSLLLLVTSVAYTLVVLYLLSPPDVEAAGVEQYIRSEQLHRTSTAADGGGTEMVAAKEITPAQRIDRNRVIGGLIALGGIVITGYIFVTSGLGALTFNVINFGLLFVGMALFASPKAYQEEFYEAVTSTAGIILQFPFYAGIIGMMNQSGLTETVANSLLSGASEFTFPAIAWITAAVVNLFIPSGGAEWTVIGEPILRSAQSFGTPPGQAIIAYATGDAYGNLLHPFWAIPLIGITGVRAREILGYSMLVMLLLSPFLAVALIVIPY